jgi:hypothetical protein
VLETAKDRNGHFRNGGMEFDVEIANVGGKVKVNAKRHDPNQLPTVLMERVSRYLEEEDGPRSKTVIVEQVSGKTDAIRRAVEELAKLGHLTPHEGGKGGGIKWELAQIYRGPVDNDPWGSLPTSSRPTPSQVGPSDLGRGSQPPKSQVGPPGPGIHTGMPGRGGLGGSDDASRALTGTEPRPRPNDLF